MISCVQILATFSTFWFINIITVDLSFLAFSLFLSLSTIARRQLYRIRYTGATVHKYLCGCCRSHRWRRILTSRDEILALRSSLHLELRNTAPTLSNHHQRRQSHAASDGRWYAGYGI